MRPREPHGGEKKIRSCLSLLPSHPILLPHTIVRIHSPPSSSSGLKPPSTPLSSHFLVRPHDTLLPPPSTVALNPCSALPAFSTSPAFVIQEIPSSLPPSPRPRRALPHYGHMRIDLTGRVVYIHCRGGHGRTGTICSLLLARAYGLSATEVRMWKEPSCGARLHKPS